MEKINVIAVKNRIKDVCLRSGRDPASVTLIAVTKLRDIEQIIEVIESGIIDIGENRVQEALAKYNELTSKWANGQAIRWHMIGHLQTNKAKDAVRIFDLIHSVDSLKLAEEIDRESAKINKLQDILIEVKTSPETTKFGVAPDETARLIEQITQLRNVKVKGLMTMAPLTDSPEKARPYFRHLRKLLEEINTLTTLSMGMSDDFEVAVEEGATMVRIGRALF